MANSYDQINKIKEKYNNIIKSKDEQIISLNEKIDSLESKVNELRKRLYDVGEGKGEQNRLKKIITAQNRENKTLLNQLKTLNGENLISTFDKDRQELIRRIKSLKFNVSTFNSLAIKFIDGLDNVIEIAALIKNNTIEDMDFFTFLFRDNIVGLFEKMLKVVLGKSETSASKYLVKLSNGEYQFPKDYYNRIPELKNKTIITNILYLINLQTTGYHGTQDKLKHVVVDKQTNKIHKVDKFLNLNNKDQLDAIFTLIKFMYDVFTNSDKEQNLMIIASSWFKTMNF